MVFTKVLSAGVDSCICGGRPDQMTHDRRDRLRIPLRVIESHRKERAFATKAARIGIERSIYAPVVRAAVVRAGILGDSHNGAAHDCREKRSRRNNRDGLQRRRQSERDAYHRHRWKTTAKSSVRVLAWELCPESD